MQATDDLFYDPRFISAVPDVAVQRVLVLGDGTDERAAEVQQLSDGDIRSFRTRGAVRALHRGLYGHRDLATGRWDLLVALEGQEPAAVESARFRTCDTHLAEVPDLVEDEWDRASPFVGAGKVAVGDLVRLTASGRIGTVRDVHRVSGGHAYDIDSEGRLLNVGEEAVERISGDPRTAEFWASQQPTDADTIGRTLTYAKMSKPLTDLLYSFAATRTTFKPYQFIPVLKVLRSPRARLLIADEVGLGKTIEAGLVWTELEQRSPLRRVLLVVPSALRYKWQHELRNRFMRDDVRLLDRRELDELLSRFRDGEDVEIVGIISLESLRAADAILQQLVDLKPSFDLVIVDEAHAVRNRETKSYDMARILSDLAECLLFLSATPLNLREDDLFNLINLLDEGHFPDVEVFRQQLVPNEQLNAIGGLLQIAGSAARARRLVHLQAIERTPSGRALLGRPDFTRLEELIDRDQPLTHEEIASGKRLIHELNTLSGVLSRTRKVDVPDRKALRQAEEVHVEWTSEERAFYDRVYAHFAARASRSNMPAGFVMQMPLRQTCSSIAVMVQRMSERAGWAVEDFEDVGTTQEPFNGEVDELDLPIGLVSTQIDSKFDALVQRLRDARRQGLRQALVFSFFRGTVDYLTRRLIEQGFAADKVHGGVKAADREAVMDRFRSGDVEILVANQVGSEGLDFQFCNVLVNYDLPWNPMQVEQRIGRLDRFGQLHDKIFIFNMSVPGTIETDIIGRLYQRIGVFERAIGDLEPIMRSAIGELHSTVLNPRLTTQQQKDEADRLAVSLARRAHELADIEASSGLLNSVGLLDIEGLTDSGPSGGRYIGVAELHRLLTSLCASTGARYEQTGERAVLRASPALLGALQALLRNDRSRSAQQLLSRLRQDEAVVLDFDASRAEDTVELVTSRHPLIRLAIERMRASEDTISRYGSVAIDGAPFAGPIWARVDRAESTGVIPVRELWISAVDDHGAPVQDAEGAMLAALAEGRWRDSSTSAGRPDRTTVDTLRGALLRRQAVTQQDRQRENQALIASRIAADEQLLRRKIDQAEERLLRARTSASPVPARIETGRLRNLRADLAAVPARYGADDEVELTTEFVALVRILPERRAQSYGS